MPRMAAQMKCPDCATNLIANVSWGRPPSKSDQVSIYKLILAAHREQGCEKKEKQADG